MENGMEYAEKLIAEKEKLKKEQLQQQKESSAWKSLRIPVLIVLGMCFIAVIVIAISGNQLPVEEVNPDASVELLTTYSDLVDEYHVVHKVLPDSISDLDVFPLGVEMEIEDNGTYKLVDTQTGFVLTGVIGEEETEIIELGVE